MSEARADADENVAPRPSRCRRRASRCRCWRRTPPTRPWRRSRTARDQLTIDGRCREPRGARARSGEGARAGYVGRDPRGRQCHRRHARPGRLGRLFRRPRAGQVDMTRALRSPGSTLKPFIYGLAFEDGFVHPGNADRGSADPLRRLRAGKFRPDLPGHGDGAQGAAAVAQRPGRGGARPVGAEPAVRRGSNRPAPRGAAQGRGAGPRHGARRRRREAARSG